MLLMERLDHQAKQAGGALYALNGNHETLNVYGRFRYATQGGFRDFIRWEYWYKYGQLWKRNCGLRAPPLGDTLHPEIETENLTSWYF